MVGIGVCNCDHVFGTSRPHRKECSIWNTVERTIPPLPLSFESASKLRKDTPIYSGLLAYFPDACAAVARLSKKANDKHNPGEPMHWARGKSNDHGDCLLRHQMTPEAIDVEVDEVHAVHVAWRALAQLQLIEERRLGPAAISRLRGDVTDD